ncbi:hypothetical protein SCP_0701470 [Sparassis crispa]|uniref:Uncharacterized protein n=1 Tax=Sparassis crispa TaxID=139825 RepID=A0A401GRX1_9APHY|nr:hypothetical protein SCP_0701470 [Sparassis crispa]GBE84965.1 hypothetical protein SCP_0701470 [Sparassis crispa]
MTILNECHWRQRANLDLAARVSRGLLKFNVQLVVTTISRQGTRTRLLIVDHAEMGQLTAVPRLRDPIYLKSSCGSAIVEISHVTRALRLMSST